MRKKYVALVLGGTVGFTAVAVLKMSLIPIGIWATATTVVTNTLNSYHKNTHAEQLMKEFAEWIASKGERKAGVSS